MVISNILYWCGLGMLATILIIAVIFETMAVYYVYPKRKYDNPKYNLAEIVLQYLPPDAILTHDLGKGWYKIELDGTNYLFNLDTKVLTKV